MSEPPSKAVFLSYASQDAAVAKRICEALRGAGVEVWFDQSELAGGDAWDAKIKRQIRECALFVPVITPHTNARTEGYFRREWKQAVERTHDMADDVPFLFPIVVGDVSEAAARVPDKFRDVQWTRLRIDETPAELGGRVAKLLSGEAGQSRPADRGTAAGSREKYAPWMRNLGMIAGLVIAVFYAMRPLWSPARRAASKPAAVAPAAPAAGETDPLVRQARELIYDPDSARNEFALADNLLKRATDLAPASGAAWGASALLHHYFFSRSYDRDRQRLVRSQAEAEKALRLEAGNGDALLALGLHRQFLGESNRAQEYLDRVLAADPENFKAILAQSQQLSGHPAKAKYLLAAADRIARPAEVLYYASIELAWSWRFEEARAACERAIAAQPFWRTYVQRAMIEESLTADPVRMNAWLDKVPDAKRDEPRVAFMRYEAAKLQREGAAAVRALTMLAADYLEDNFYTGPKAYLLAHAHELAGQPGVAAEQWQLAERTVREKLAADPGGILLRSMLAVILAGQHRPAEARALAEACAADDRLRRNTMAIENVAEAFARLGEPASAIALLRTIPAAAVHTGGIYAANLPVNPQWDALRGQPGYAELVAGLKQAQQADPAADAPDPDNKSVAVLAFANLSDEKANEYFSDGISEELLNVLAKVPGLKVSARTSAFYFKGRAVPIPEIAKQLGVAYVIEGSVRKQGDKVRITAQLIKAADGFRLWSDTFTRDLKDIFAVQDEIAGLIAKNLEIKMGMAAARPTIDVEAYQEYLAGRAAGAKAGNPDLREAVTHFERAVAIEPNFTAAWVQLASAQTRLGRWGGVPTLQAWQAARAAIDRARALEPDSPDVLLALGWILRTAEWDWRGAERAFRRTLELQPNQPDALTGAAVLLFNIGRTEEAFHLGQQAARLDPLNPVTQIDLGLMFFFNKNWAESERSVRRALKLAPGGASYHGILSWSLIKQGRYAEAEAEARLETDEIEQATVYGLLALARGQPDEARKMLAQLEAIARTRGVDSADLQQTIAWLAAGLGDKDRAFAALERARASRDPSMTWLRNGEYLAALFSDPRWDVLLRRMGLTDEQLK